MIDEKLGKIIEGNIKGILLRVNLPKQIEDAFKDEKLKKDIAERVSTNFKGQIEKRAEDIKRENAKYENRIMV